MSGRSTLLVVGGGPAGLSAARSYRDAGGTGPVAIVTDEHRMPYQRPPLTKELLRGEATEDDLPLEHESWLSEHEVVADRRPRRRARRRRAPRRRSPADASSRTTSCVLATGAEPTRLPVPGADDPGGPRAAHARPPPRAAAAARPRRVAVVIGSGFIGCEIAASLRIRGHRGRAGLRREPRRTSRGSATRRPRIGALAARSRAWRCTSARPWSGSSGARRARG